MQGVISSPDLTNCAKIMLKKGNLFDKHNAPIQRNPSRSLSVSQIAVARIGFPMFWARCCLLRQRPAIDTARVASPIFLHRDIIRSFSTTNSSTTLTLTIESRNKFLLVMPAQYNQSLYFFFHGDCALFRPNRITFAYNKLNNCFNEERFDGPLINIVSRICRKRQL